MSNDIDPFPEKFWVQTVTIGDGSDEDPRRPKLDYGGEPWKWSGYGEVNAPNRVVHTQTTEAGRTNLLADPDVIEIPPPQDEQQTMTQADRDIYEIMSAEWGWTFPGNISQKLPAFHWLLDNVIVPDGRKGRPEPYFRSR